ncbi:hypothetical protein [Streptomyces sp. NPDC048665]
MYIGLAALIAVIAARETRGSDLAAIEADGTTAQPASEQPTAASA